MRESIRHPRIRRMPPPLAVAAAIAATAAFGQDQAAVDPANPRGIEEIVVIGSRARVETLANELPVGVDVFQGADVERAGEADLGAALTKLAPSFNYSRQSVGDGALLRAATLRGLSPDQTLVLVNGKRRHNMAWLRVLDGVIGYGAGGTDLGAIPSTALSRVEVLRDGAAAQYGSDAIAGVINLQLRNDADGAEFTVQGGTGDGNGSRLGAAFNGGLPLGDGGFLNVTAEWYKEEPLNRNGGNGGLDPNYQDRLITHSSPLNDSAFLFLNGEIPVGDDSEVYGFGGLSRREGLASGAYRYRYNYWEGLQSGDETWDFVVPNFINFHERNTHPVYP
ncbi:MAG: TonB-dependent receptor plug domain-containing protein, partial [Rhodospirillaceae bacterium]|nr:TonB-dependent receptor plug domain-containing protein [Rhodospirillaceae bacterium]